RSTMLDRSIGIDARRLFRSTATKLLASGTMSRVFEEPEANIGDRSLPAGVRTRAKRGSAETDEQVLERGKRARVIDGGSRQPATVVPSDADAHLAAATTENHVPSRVRHPIATRSAETFGRKESALLVLFPECRGGRLDPGRGPIL